MLDPKAMTPGEFTLILIATTFLSLALFSLVALGVFSMTKD